MTSLLATVSTPSVSRGGGIIDVDWAGDWPQQSSSRVTEVRPQGRGVLVPLYLSFATLQALDAHSTIRALRAGSVEQNPLLRGIASQPVALVALKASLTASTIFLTERFRTKNRTGAIVLMAAVNSFYAMLVNHNYRAVRQGI